MCTLVILRRPGHGWPLVLAGNRDEMGGRDWRAPARHWPDRPEVVAGLDLVAGGSWFGVNDWGVAAAVMNRWGSLGPAPGRRSRGELVLEALDHGDAQEAARALAALEPSAYRPFNLCIADPKTAWWLRHTGARPAIEVREIPAGLHMLGAGELDDPDDPRLRRHLPRFRAATEPDPVGGWGEWPRLLASTDGGAEAALCFTRADGFGTLCSQLLALPRHPGFDGPPVFRFAGGRPDRSPFQDVPL